MSEIFRVVALNIAAANAKQNEIERIAFVDDNEHHHLKMIKVLSGEISYGTEDLGKIRALRGKIIGI